ncbi:hypothetical protein ASG93_18730 [Paenibacillus sp. Soil787]|nr:hypothetical protein ASG93_18730 [Paenibacillus sp. Soil787]
MGDLSDKINLVGKDMDTVSHAVENTKRVSESTKHLNGCSFWCSMLCVILEAYSKYLFFKQKERFFTWERRKIPSMM